MALRFATVSGASQADGRSVLSRERIVAAARAQIERVGLERLSLREVARSLGVTAAALYAHVDGKSGLIAAVADDAFAELSKRFAEIDTGDPIERIRSQLNAYVDHAVSSPGIYDVMMRFAPDLPVGVGSGGDVSFGPATTVFTMAAGAISEAADAGRIRIGDPLVAALGMWAVVHGLVDVLRMGFGLPASMAADLRATVIEGAITGVLNPS